jgi:hypothetical protein
LIPLKTPVSFHWTVPLRVRKNIRSVEGLQNDRGFQKFDVFRVCNKQAIGARQVQGLPGNSKHCSAISITSRFAKMFDVFRVCNEQAIGAQQVPRVAMK